MQTALDFSDPLTAWLALALLGLAVLQTVLLWWDRSRGQPTWRWWVRVGLNAGLWLALVGLVAQPRWPVDPSERHWLLVGNDVPASVVGSFSKTFSQIEPIQVIDNENDKIRNHVAAGDSLTLLGQGFSATVLSRLAGRPLCWIPYFGPNVLQTLTYRAVLRQGDEQQVTGRLQTSRRAMLRVESAGQTLDSLPLKPGNSGFTLRFPVLAQGRVEAWLTLDRRPLDTLRFFARPALKVSYRFQLNAPDFEIKTLATWLGRRGQAVDLSVALAPGMINQLTINTKKQDPDILITEPGKADDPLVRQTLARGRAVLFVNLADAPADLSRIDRATGCDFSAHKISNAESVSVSAGITAMPYQFVERLGQLNVPGLPVAVQRGAGGGRVAVSLLTETFPLQLQGDSLTYARVWLPLLDRLRPPDPNAIAADAPFFAGQSVTFQATNWPVSFYAPKNRFLPLADDTLRLRPSPLNPRSATGQYLFGKPGWQSLTDSVVVFVGKTGREGGPVARNRQMQQFMQTQRAAPTAETAPPPVGWPDWLWWVLVLAWLTALWIEPKL